MLGEFFRIFIYQLRWLKLGKRVVGMWLEGGMSNVLFSFSHRGDVGIIPFFNDAAVWSHHPHVHKNIFYIYIILYYYDVLFMYFIA